MYDYDDEDYDYSQGEIALKKTLEHLFWSIGRRKTIKGKETKQKKEGIIDYLRKLLCS